MHCGRILELSIHYLKFRENSSVYFPFILQEKKLLLDKNGPRVARISVFEVCNEVNLFSLSVQYFCGRGILL